MKTTLRSIFISLICASIILGGAPAVFAISNGDISIAPAQQSDENDARTKSWFIYDLAPGATIQDSLYIKNESDQTRSVRLYAVDAYTTEQGGFALRNENDKKENIGAWIQLDGEIITLRPQEEKIVPFTYTVSASVEPGEYAGGIVAQDIEPIKGQGISVVKRVGARIYHTIPGERYEKISLLSSNIQVANNTRWGEASVKNTGNVSLDLVLKEDITDSSGSQVAHLESAVQTLLPGSSVVMTTSSWKQPLFGKFTISGSIYDAKSEKELVQIAPEEFVVINVFFAGALAVGFVLLLLLIFLIARRKKSGKKKKRKSKK